MRKKLITLFLAMAVMTGAALSADAATSISEIIPENPTVTDESLSEGQTLIVQNADTSAYENKTVAEVVETFNDDNTITTIKEVLDTLEVDTSSNTTTASNKTVNPTLYEALTPFVDLAVQESDGSVHYNTNGSVTATVTIEAAKEREASDLLLMQIDPTTGTVYFITVDELDSETGEITATFPTLGAVALVEKVPIVVKNTSPEKYGHEPTAEFVRDFEDQKRNISFYDVLKDLVSRIYDYDDDYVERRGSATVYANTAVHTTSSGEAEQEEESEAVTEAQTEAESETEDETEIVLKEQIEVAEDVYINIEDYSSAMGFADMAIKQGEDEYIYNMSGSLLAEANRDLDEVDWERIVLYMDPDYDTEAATEDLSLLTEIEPFVLENCFVMQVNSETGAINYIWEPEVYFTILNSEEDEDESETEIETETEAETGEETEAESETETEDDDYLLRWTVTDEDKASDDEVPVLVIRGEFEAMGPFALFMPVDSELETE
ncbi:MAG: hypothetical protein LIP10_11610 [Clostridiales bacterium]|nr:hypothetical protein [Clostridiales bacterium]